MDINKDKKYFWIAREGLKVSLPEPWKPCKTKTNEIYYFNFQTGESTWEHPLDSFYEEKFKSMKKQDEEKAKQMIKQTI